MDDSDNLNKQQQNKITDLETKITSLQNKFDDSEKLFNEQQNKMIEIVTLLQNQFNEQIQNQIQYSKELKIGCGQSNPTLQLRVIEAKNVPKMDHAGKSDPFVKAGVIGLDDPKKTKYVSNTYTPT